MYTACHVIDVQLKLPDQYIHKKVRQIHFCKHKLKRPLLQQKRGCIFLIYIRANSILRELIIT